MSSHVREWCGLASNRIISAKSASLSSQHIKYILEGNGKGGLIGKVFHAKTGYGIIDNQFALVVKESKGAVLAVKLPAVTTDGNEARPTGFHIPALDSKGDFGADKIFRAKRGVREGGMACLRGDRKSFTIWDGTPQYFDHND